MTESTENSKRTKTTHTLRCGAQGCCPTAEVDHETKKLVLKDDYGGTVTLTAEEWQDAVEKVKF